MTSTPAPIRLDLSLVLDVDPSAWATEYGLPADGVVEDATNHLVQTVRALVEEHATRLATFAVHQVTADGDGPGRFACASCGVTTATTYVVTGDVNDKEGRTEVCRDCDTAERVDLPQGVAVTGHRSTVHDGVNVEIDAPEGMRVTVHLNDWKQVDEVIGA